MKKLMILSLGYILSTLSLLSDTEKVGSYTWYYQLNGNTAEIYRDPGNVAVLPTPQGGTVTIPSTLGGKPVTSIGRFAFVNCMKVEGIVIPQGITTIKMRAFLNCTALTSINIPSSVTSIEQGAFEDCKTSLFQNSNGINLLDGWAIGTNRYFNGRSSLNLTGFSGIGGGAFADCKDLTQVMIPSTVKSICGYAFSGCDKLENVTINAGAKIIEEGAFCYCTNLTNVTIPDSVTSIGTVTFWHCSKLTNVSIGTNVTSIGDRVFKDCVNLDTMRFLGNAPSLGNNVFEGCSNNPTVFVTRTSTGWGVPIPGTWNGLSIFYDKQIVSFDANGGVCATKTSVVEHGAPVGALPTASRPGYVFLGWFTAAGNAVTPATVITDDMTFHAMWEARAWTLEACLDATNLIFSDDSVTAWTPDWELHKVGDMSLRSGAIPAATEEGGRTNTTLTTTVVGTGSGSFWWKVHCEEMDEVYDEWYDYAAFLIDGVEVAKIAGDSGWRQVDYSVVGSGTHVLTWMFSRDDYDETGAEWQNYAWVDGVNWTPTPVTVTFDAGGAPTGVVPAAVTKYEGYELTLPDEGTLANGMCIFKGWSDGETTYDSGTVYVFGAADVTLTAVWELKIWTLEEAVDTTKLSFVTGGDAEWRVDRTTGWTNDFSVKSGVVTTNQASWIETTVAGSGTLTFHWNVMGGIYRNNPFAYAKVEVDGVQQALEYSTDGWKGQTVTLEGLSLHKVRWTYMRTSSREAVGDCAWLDAVKWIPSVETMGMEAWLAERHLTANARGANGRTATECYVLGLDPADAMNDLRIVSIELVDSKPHVEWEPKTNRWTGMELRAALKGAATLEGPWDDVPQGGNPAFRFFKVVVEP